MLKALGGWRVHLGAAIAGAVVALICLALGSEAPAGVGILGVALALIAGISGAWGFFDQRRS